MITESRKHFTLMHCGCQAKIILKVPVQTPNDVKL
jgi:hypothetical protein